MADMIRAYFSAVDETKKALFVSDGRNRMWLPKSKIRVTKTKGPGSSDVAVDMPKWLARAKGVII